MKPDQAPKPWYLVTHARGAALRWIWCAKRHKWLFMEEKLFGFESRKDAQAERDKQRKRSEASAWVFKIVSAEEYKRIRIANVLVISSEN